jgi:hypothetical protein
MNYANISPKRQYVSTRPFSRRESRKSEHVTQAGVSQEELQVLVVQRLRQVAPSAGVLVYPEPQAEGNCEQDGEQRSRRVPCNIQE